MMSNTSYTTQLAVFCVLASAAGIACPFTCCAARRRATSRSTRPLPARQARAGSIKLRFPRTENCSLAFSAVRHSQWAATLCYGMSGPPGVFGPGAAFPASVPDPATYCFAAEPFARLCFWTVAGLRRSVRPLGARDHAPAAQTGTWCAN